MNDFSLGDRFRLEIHWDKAKYDRDGVCTLEGAKFSGPVLKEALKLNDKDHILLDFFSQYILLVKSVYVAKFSWEGVHYNSDNTISLKKATLSHESELNSVPKLRDTDFLVIDTENHTVEEHQFNLVYKTFVVDKTTELYNFGG